MLNLAILLALASAAAAKHCTNITIPVSISARNGVFDIKLPKTEVEVTNFFLNVAKQNSNYSSSVTKGVSPTWGDIPVRDGCKCADACLQFETVKGDYKLAATYCEPDSGAGQNLQILTHGIGFDRSYWDFPYDNTKYSYVNKAVDQGYSTLSYDRLGIGQSSHGDPISEIQIFLEIAALKELTQQVKAGGCGPKFKKIVHVGHSFGSAITFALTNMYPTISDAIVLTGFSQVSSFFGLFALGGNFAPVKVIPTLKDQYVEGYVAAKTSIGVQSNFFAPGDFDPKVLDVATKTGQPAAVGEILTLASAGSTSDFGGPVLIITGGSSHRVIGPGRTFLRFPLGSSSLRFRLANFYIDRDIPFCGGDCKNTVLIQNSAPNLIESSRPSFKAASVFNATIIPGAGHGLNLQYTAGITYKAILDFLASHL